MWTVQAREDPHRNRLCARLQRRGVNECGQTLCAENGAQKYVASSFARDGGDARQVLDGFVDFANDDFSADFPGLRVPDPSLDMLSMGFAQMPAEPSDVVGVPAIYLQRQLYLVDDEEIATHETVGFVYVVLPREEIDTARVRTREIASGDRADIDGWRQQVEASPSWSQFAPLATGVFIS